MVFKTGKSGFCLFTLYMLRKIRGKGDGRGISGFAVNRGTVNRGFTVVEKNPWHKDFTESSSLLYWPAVQSHFTGSSHAMVSRPPYTKYSL